MRGAVYAVVTGPPAALNRSAGISIAVRGRLAMNHRTVARTAAAEIMPLDAARKAVTFRDAYNVNPVAGFELGDRDRLTGFDAFDILAKLARPAARFHAGFLVMSGHGAVHARLLHVT